MKVETEDKACSAVLSTVGLAVTVESDGYFTERFGGASLCQIRQAPRQHCELDTVADLADRVMFLEAWLAEVMQYVSNMPFSRSLRQQGRELLTDMTANVELSGCRHFRHSART